MDAFSKIAKLLLKIDCKSSINKFILSNPKSAREDIIKFIIKNYLNKINSTNNIEKENILLQKLLKDYESLLNQNCFLAKFAKICLNLDLFVKISHG